MGNEKKEVVTEKETEKETHIPTEEKGEKTPNEEVETTEKKEEEKKEEEKLPNGEENVAETEDTGNGIPLSEVVLKKDLLALVKEQLENYTKDALASMQSKVDAVTKENEDLKNALAEAKGDSDKLRAKYEDNGDFGVPQSKSQLNGTTKQGNSNYVSYEDMWGGKKEFDK